MKKTGCFKDNIRNLFLLYAIIPVMLMAAGALLVIVLVWRNALIKEVNHSNAVVSNALEQTVSIYSDGLNQLCKGDVIRRLLENPSAKSEIQSEIFAQIYKIRNRAEYPADIYIINEKRKSILNQQDKLPDGLRASENGSWGIYRQLEENPERICMKIVTESDGKHAELLLGRLLVLDDKITAYVIIVLESEKLDYLLSSVTKQTMITDWQGRIFAANQYVFSDNLNRINSKVSGKKEFLSYKNKYYMVHAVRRDNSFFKVYTIADISSQVESFEWIAGFLAAVFAAVLFTVSISAEPLAGKHTKELFEIVEAFEQNNKGNLNVHLFLKSCQEFQTIGNAYNTMLQSMKMQIAQNRKMTEDIAFVKLKQLESQFNPHFIYNTLENIRIMIKLEPKQADAMILALSSLLRYSVRHDKDCASIQEDMEKLKNYLNILKMRFQKKFQYEIRLEESILDCQIPRLLFQPLIENAIQYGMEDKGRITVTMEGREKKGKVVLSCCDDGSGIDSSVLEEINLILSQPDNTSGHLGLYNIHKRIRLKYGEEYGVQIQSEKGAGTKVQVTLPKDRKRE